MKSYMSFRLVPKSLTLNDHERRNGAYFALFHRIWYTSFQHMGPRYKLRCSNVVSTSEHEVSWSNDIRYL